MPDNIKNALLEMLVSHYQKSEFTYLVSRLDDLIDYFFLAVESRFNKDATSQLDKGEIIKNATYFRCVEMIEENGSHFVFNKIKLWEFYYALEAFNRYIKDYLPTYSEEGEKALITIKSILDEHYREQ